MARKRRTNDQPIGVGLTTRQMKRRKPLGSDYLIDIDPLTDNQKKLFESYANQKHLVAYGCAGTGKTFITLYNALKEVLNERSPYEKVYIVVDDIKCEWEKTYLSYFKKYNPIIVTNTPKEDFFFLMSFNKIINSNSTFSYWASFFSDAEKIYTFKNAGFYGRNKIHIEHTKNLCNIKNVIYKKNTYKKNNNERKHYYRR